jgi:outer membrane protein assembly factor BamB
MSHRGLLRIALLLAVTLSPCHLVTLSARAADWPQFRGRDRSGVSRETGLLASWPKAGPKLVWKCDVAGQGYAGLAVVGGRVYTMGARGADEYALCLDEKGKEAWATKIGPVWDFRINRWSRGPNATPTVDGNRVYCLGSQGVLVCVEKATGKQLWRKDLPKELAGEVEPGAGGPPKMGWGYCWSPLVDGDKLICVPGGPQGLFAALDKKSGKVLWRSKEVTDQATYSSPIATEAGGVRQYVVLTPFGPVGVSARDGKLLWRNKRAEAYPDVVCPTPICTGDLVYVSVGYGAGCELLKLVAAGGKLKAEVLYAEREIGNKQGGVVLVGKHVYGFDEDRVWMCQELATGKIAWETERGRKFLQAGSVLAADGKLYVLEERTGVVGLLVASPKGYKELGRFKLPSQSKLRKEGGRIWTHPSLADGKLYLRDQELVFCYQVK